MTNLMETLDRDERYSYVFEGNTQTLDQILVTRALRRGAEYDSVHVNAEFFDQASITTRRSRGWRSTRKG